MPDQDDPTAQHERRMEQLRSQLQGQLFSEIGGLQKLLETRLDGMDRALSRAEDFPTDLDRMAGRLEALFNQKLKAQGELVNEKIGGLKALLTEQRESARDAVEKSEEAMRAQLAATTGQITTLKERVDKTEGKGAGALQLWSLLMVGAMLVFAALAFAFSRTDVPAPQAQPPMVYQYPAPQPQPQPPVVEERR